MGDVQRPVCFQVHQDRVGSWPWCGPWDDGLAEARFRYSLTTLTVPRCCLGMARRRMGRGGRSVKFLFPRFGLLWVTLRYHAFLFNFYFAHLLLLFEDILQSVLI